jgi:bifunctional enzyme CysN/CysC
MHTSNTTEQLKIVIVGHVDHGKSTFVGRLFHDTGSLPEGKLEQLQKVAERRGVPFEWANLMDALPSAPDALDYTVHSPVTLSPAVVP